jgi:hypothetical protein
MDTQVHPELINARFAYVSISRASSEVHIYTDSSSSLSNRLGHMAAKTSALEMAEALNI